MAKENIILKELEEIAEKLGIKMRYEKTQAKGGMCMKNGTYMIIIDKNAAIDYKINIISKSLKQFDLSNLFLSPKIRELLEES